MKIDPSTIQGFDSMTTDQKLAAVLGIDIPEPDMTGWVKKDVFDAKATEAANLAKQLRAKMTDEEAAKEVEATKYKELSDKYDALLKQNTIAEYKAKYLAMAKRICSECRPITSKKRSTVFPPSLHETRGLEWRYDAL